MNISFSPQFSDEKLEILKVGESLTINGDFLDFTDLPDGASYPPEAIENNMVDGGVVRIDGKIQITIRLPYNLSNPPHTVTSPHSVTVTTDGRLPLPTDGVEDHASE